MHFSLKGWENIFFEVAVPSQAIPDLERESVLSFMMASSMLDRRPISTPYLPVLPLSTRKKWVWFGSRFAPFEREWLSMR